MSKVGLLVNLRPRPRPLTSIFWGRNLTNLHWFPFIHLQTCYISVIRGKPYCQWVGSYWRRNCLNIYFANYKSSLRDLLACKCVIGKAKDLLHSFRYWLGFKLSCIVMFVLLVCDFCQTTYSFGHVCSWIFLKKPWINTGYSVYRLIIISIFFYYYHRF